jgi:hypothetical protein
MTKLTAKRGMAARATAAAAPRRAVAAWTPPVRAASYVSAKAVGSWVPKLTQKAFEKYGFSTATLLTEWTAIAGEQLAAASVPERVKWPRGVETFGEADAGGGSRSGATLILRVDPSRALDVEYQSAQIIGRINAYFGYRAIAELRVLQAPVPVRTAMAPARPRTAQVVTAGLDPLTAALARFEAGVMARAKPA